LRFVIPYLLEGAERSGNHSPNYHAANAGKIRAAHLPSWHCFNRGMLHELSAGLQHTRPRTPASRMGRRGELIFLPSAAFDTV